MTKDIVVRLRESCHEGMLVAVGSNLLTSAADEIDRLRIQLQETTDLYNASRRQVSDQGWALDNARQEAYENSRSNTW